MSKRVYKKWLQLTSQQQEEAETRASYIGYKKNELMRLEYEIVAGKVVSIMDKYLLSNVF